MRKNKFNVLGGFMVGLTIVLGTAVFILLAGGYGRDRSDYIDLATMEAKALLRTVVVAIQTTGGTRACLQDAGVPSHVVQEVVDRCGTDLLLQRLGTYGMFDYLVCQDEAGIVAGYGTRALSSVKEDPFLHRALAEDTFGSRTLTGEPTRIEAVLPFTTDTHKKYMVRVCISLGSVSEIEQRKIVRMVLCGGAMVAVTLLFVTYLFNLHTARMLAHERAAITEDVHQIQDRLRQQERASAMGRLAAAVAHEVRNPLNALTIVVQRLERETRATPESADKFAEFTQVLRKEMKRLDKIVEDFVEFSKAKATSCMATDPAALARDVCCLEQGVVQEHGITLRQDIASCTPLMADPVQLTQALLNILKNAIEATPSGGEITVSVVQDNASTIFRVEDTGRGFTAEEREHAFDLYYSHKEGGSGIGLAVTRRIVEQHNGTITLHARAPRGTAVEIIIPTKCNA